MPTWVEYNHPWGESKASHHVQEKGNSSGRGSQIFRGIYGVIQVRSEEIQCGALGRENNHDCVEENLLNLEIKLGIMLVRMLGFIIKKFI